MTGSPIVARQIAGTNPTGAVTRSYQWLGTLDYGERYPSAVWRNRQSLLDCLLRGRCGTRGSDRLRSGRAAALPHDFSPSNESRRIRFTGKL